MMIMCDQTVRDKLAVTWHIVHIGDKMILKLSLKVHLIYQVPLLSKLLSYGIQKPHIDWFKSYLNKRKQRVFVNGNISDTMPITSGVPQGSILGPLLFLIYINDFTQSSDFFSMRLFADDTSLTASAKNIDELLFEINKELPNIYDWLCANKLTLNLRKTKYLIFQPCQKVDYNLFPLSIARQCLEEVSKMKYLGIYIDSHLSLAWPYRLCVIESARVLILWQR